MSYRFHRRLRRNIHFFKFSEVLEQLRDNQMSVQYGLAFEKFMVRCFGTDPALMLSSTKSYRLTGWKYNGGAPEAGIDLVARGIEDCPWVATQCKFYMPTTRVA